MKPPTTIPAGFRNFNFPDKVIAPIPLRPRALWKISVAEHVLNCDRDGVITRVQDGRIAWCFCLSELNQRKRDLRCLAASVMEAANLQTGLPKRTAAMSFEEVMELIWPYRRDPRGVEIKKLFVTSHGQVTKIAQRGGLKISVRARHRDGPWSSHNYSRASLVEFLRKGRVIS